MVWLCVWLGPRNVVCVFLFYFFFFSGVVVLVSFIVYVLCVLFCLYDLFVVCFAHTCFCFLTGGCLCGMVLLVCEYLFVY